jgi:hypothetical protein
MRVLILIVFTGLLFCGQSLAGEVQIVDAKAVQQGDAWSFSVTLKHDDSGWEHYADAWRVVSTTGEIFGVRTLLHPHENEQPFTRSLNGVPIPAATSLVYIEAHDKVHDWAGQKFELRLQTP